MLFKADEKLEPETLKALAEAIGLDMHSFNQCLTTGKYQAEIAKDIEQGRKAGVDMTPSFIINGKLIPGGPPFERLKEIIEEELKKEVGLKAN